MDKNADARDSAARIHAFVERQIPRPADLWTPNYNVPMRDSLLWVYEGQTQYWGSVLAARSGLVTKQQALDELASTAATYDHRAGREWRPLQDTTNDPIVALRRPLAWRSWQRSEDYYSEGQLIWLDVDTLIREQSRGQRSLDDFARAFFGINDGSRVPATYTFEDVVNALNRVQPYEWEKFLRSRLEGYGPGAPLDGLGRGGYKLVYTETAFRLFQGLRSSPESHGPDVLSRHGHRQRRQTDRGDVGRTRVQERPCRRTQVVAVNGTAYSGERSRRQLETQRGTAAPSNSGQERRALPYHPDGLPRWVALPAPGTCCRRPAHLDQILTAR